MQLTIHMSVIDWVFTQMPWFMVIEKFVTPSDVFKDSLRHFVTKQALVVGVASFWEKNINSKHKRNSNKAH